MKLLIRQALLPLFVVSIWLPFACTKIEPTNLGADIIPDVDNINTFDTVLQVVSSNIIPEDSTRWFFSDPHAAGGISNDPQFGTSKASLFFQPIPASFPFKFAVSDSIVGFDSAVVVLNYVGYYGDSAAPVTYNLYITDEVMQRDTLLRPNYTLRPNIQVGRLLGSATKAANMYRDTTFIRRGTDTTAKVINQLRIPLSRSEGQRIFNLGIGDGTANDTLFRQNLPGLALVPQGSPNALHYFSLSSVSGIELYYRQKSGKLDTATTSFGLTFSSAHAVDFVVNRSGAELSNYLSGGADGVDQIYISAVPAVAANIDVPGLANLSNRLIHRAELRMVEITPNTGLESQLTPPPVLYLDLRDSSNTFKGIPYDLSPFSNYFCFPTQGIQYFYFGGQSRKEMIDGADRYAYRFNVSRYLQGVISRKEQYLNFRLWAPYYAYYKNCSNSNAAFPVNYFRVLNSNNVIANVPGSGRVRLAGGNHPNPNLRMQMRIIYSKLQ